MALDRLAFVMSLLNSNGGNGECGCSPESTYTKEQIDEMLAKKAEIDSNEKITNPEIDEIVKIKSGDSSAEIEADEIDKDDIDSLF